MAAGPGAMGYGLLRQPMPPEGRAAGFGGTSALGAGVNKAGDMSPFSPLNAPSAGPAGPGGWWQRNIGRVF
jgi:hypothetical protein